MFYPPSTAVLQPIIGGFPTGLACRLASLWEGHCSAD